MIINSISNIKSENLFYHFQNFVTAADVFLKFEGLNVAGSIKLKTAVHLLNGVEKIHGVKPGELKIIESSSGNLGIALSIVCKERGYDFTCVTDPNISPLSEQYIKIYGGKIIKVTEKDPAGGYLTTRINLINKILKEDSKFIWTNQYSNVNNINAHYLETAKEILTEIQHIDYLFIGAGTTGTLMGCAKFFKEFSLHTKIIAVDSVGSITFGKEPSRRFIPGLGTSRRPEITNEVQLDEIIMAHEKDAVKMCNYLLDNYGLFLGGSSGSVMHAIQTYQNYTISNPRIVAISPDFGNKYVDSIYNQEWINSTFT